jgi:hypothetical protein
MYSTKSTCTIKDIKKMPCSPDKSKVRQRGHGGNEKHHDSHVWPEVSFQLTSHVHFLRSVSDTGEHNVCLTAFVFYAQLQTPSELNVCRFSRLGVKWCWPLDGFGRWI